MFDLNTQLENLIPALDSEIEKHIEAANAIIARPNFISPPPEMRPEDVQIALSNAQAVIENQLKSHKNTVALCQAARDLAEKKLVPVFSDRNQEQFDFHVKHRELFNAAIAADRYKYVPGKKLPEAGQKAFKNWETVHASQASVE